MANINTRFTADFQVTDPLPNVTFPMGRNWAGNIPVDRPGHPNNTLFFWGFEKENGSLTAAANENSNEPWGIWLNGGQNGPLHIRNDYSMFSNNFSWDHLADYIWVDQPVGTGFSTCDEQGFGMLPLAISAYSFGTDLASTVADEDQMGEDFFGFLNNLVKVFPSLKTRPLHLTGESYAGTYIPYITKTYFGMSDPPVNLTKIAIGDGSIGSGIEFEWLPMLTVIETYPQLINYDPEVYQMFRDQSHLCGFDLNLTYPQNGHFPSLNPQLPSNLDTKSIRTKKKTVIKQALMIDAQMSKRGLEVDEVRMQKRDEWKREAQRRASGGIDPTYGCDLFDELIDYALQFSFPWEGNDISAGFDVYNIPDALDPEAPMDGSVFLNGVSWSLTV
ncbi:hypothetical protein EW026_g1946 [Hermanssonia centrifuga]|uniref:Carboxypeptidase n=1 Tax=Hermanssonia centrifuga TaxID=98765 RepID=A0A4S4KPT2_9APHY|nr:hypothetical protein EW026_g1946 [Hermanssonia centrifuga]